MEFAKELIQSAKEALDMAKGQLEPTAVFDQEAAGSAVFKIGSDLRTNPRYVCKSGEKADEPPQD